MGRLDCITLTKVYDNRQVALDKVSFSVETKGIFGLIGRNGAGKTTLIRILATELEPTSGSAFIDGLDVFNQAHKLRERITIIPQEARAVRWMTPKQTVFSYLLWRGYPYKEANRLAEESLTKLGLTPFRDVLNSKLSGGTKRKVLIATVIASEAPIIFLDEPTVGLDPISRRELWDILRELGKSRFIFLTTHYLEEAEQLANKLGILKEGKLISVGDLAELRKNVRYQYSLKLSTKIAVPKTDDAEITVSNNGYTQIMTNEEEAFRLARLFSEQGVKFSITPITLDDIFFRLACQRAGDEGET
ncbi:MAG: ABC transporter ATP-binding protein [Nitrososphaerota archaeon]|jgi:ABC-2 type transport system ATP-binding protein|nr:ABC transporter ATP-binding protein [Nitrososphaerota archaeon]